MASYAKSLSVVRRLEGGYVNNPKDRGGETWRGITRRWYPQWDGWAIIDSYKDKPSFKHLLAEDEKLAQLVNDFYYQERWLKLGLDEIVSQQVADEILESSVIFGINPAVKIAQEALNMLNKAGVLYKDTKVDGVMGKETKRLLNAFKDMTSLLRTLNLLQGERFMNIVRDDPSQEIFFYGWLIRT